MFNSSALLYLRVAGIHKWLAQLSQDGSDIQHEAVGRNGSRVDLGCSEPMLHTWVLGVLTCIAVRLVFKFTILANQSRTFDRVSGETLIRVFTIWNNWSFSELISLMAILQHYINYLYCLQCHTKRPACIRKRSGRACLYPREIQIRSPTLLDVRWKITS